jgi:hypothetical protein
MVYPIGKWYNWVREQPWTIKWFIYLLLLRPFFDRFWNIKDPVFHLSILDLIGVLVPVMIIFILASRQLPFLELKTPDKIFLALGGIVLSNLVYFFIMRTTLLWFGVIVKILMPFLLYFYLRHWLTSQRTLHGLLTTVVYSCIFPALIFLTETIANSNPTQLSRGMERFSGGYADVFNYSIYFIFLFLILAYTNMAGRRKSTWLSNDLYPVIIAAITIFVMIRIHHMASLVVFLILFFVWALFRLYRGRLLSTFIIINLLIVFSLGIQLTDHMVPLVENEIAVIKGEKKIEKALHGRVQRWQRMLDDFNQSNVLFRIMNPAFADPHSYGYMIAGSHNDYLRMLFLGGYTALALYLVFLYLIFSIRKQLHFTRLFLKNGAFLTLVLFSITSVPTMYAPIMYIILIIFVYSVSR